MPRWWIKYEYHGEIKWYNLCCCNGAEEPDVIACFHRIHGTQFKIIKVEMEKGNVEDGG